MTDSTTRDDLWPDALDALRAAPRHHTLVFENAAVRVLETRIRPGERTAVHTHRWPGVLHILSWSAMVRRDANGDVTFDSRTQPPSEAPSGILWSPALPAHSLENVGTADIHVIAVEVKSGAV